MQQKIAPGRCPFHDSSIRRYSAGKNSCWRVRQNDSNRHTSRSPTFEPWVLRDVQERETQNEGRIMLVPVRGTVEVTHFVG